MLITYTYRIAFRRSSFCRATVAFWSTAQSILHFLLLIVLHQLSFISWNLKVLWIISGIHTCWYNLLTCITWTWIGIGGAWFRHTFVLFSTLWVIFTVAAISTPCWMVQQVYGILQLSTPTLVLQNISQLIDRVRFQEISLSLIKIRIQSVHVAGCSWLRA